MNRAVRPPLRRVDGVLLLDKPRGLSSNIALQRARHLLRAEKAGHTGTLDPEATGLLPLCFGEATKFSSRLLEAAKGYEAELRLGETSTTGDAEGAILPGPGPVPDDAAAVHAVLRSLLGAQQQVPPMHSALKHDGRPLYDYARAGVEVARPVRQIVVQRLELLAFSGHSLRVQADCSKGTYIRVLAEEIGRRLGCGAWLSALRRNRTGGFALDDAITLDALTGLDEDQRTALLLPPERLVADLTLLVLDADQADGLVHGRSPALDPLTVLPPVDLVVRAHDPAGRFLGLVRRSAQDRIVAVRLMAEPAK
ncbi:MAG: tRNA pseudouridine(55) synthase TruB [Pseudomonadota bacterium]|nr:tRNA pseudouridine(55) synthase TruB [Pseudomonadota bacterium]